MVMGTVEKSEAEKAAYREKLKSLTIGTRKVVRRDGPSWFDTTIKEQQDRQVAEARANGHDIVPVGKRWV